MKKTYFSPTLEVMRIESCRMICTSPVDPSSVNNSVSTQDDYSQKKDSKIWSGGLWDSEE